MHAVATTNSSKINFSIRLSLSLCVCTGIRTDTHTHHIPTYPQSTRMHGDHFEIRAFYLCFDSGVFHIIYSRWLNSSELKSVCVQSKSIRIIEVFPAANIWFVCVCVWIRYNIVNNLCISISEFFFELTFRCPICNALTHEKPFGMIISVWKVSNGNPIFLPSFLCFREFFRILSC